MPATSVRKKLGIFVIVLLSVFFVSILVATIPKDYVDLIEIVDVDEMPKSIKIISFNVGLLDVNLLGYSIMKPADYIDDRANAISSALKSQDADIIAIQELYIERHAELLIDEMKGLYPYYYRKSTAMLRIDNGLLVFSRFPIREQRMSTLRSGPWDEAVFASKSIMSVQIAIDPTTNLNVVNMHPTSGGMLNAQDSEKITRVRQNQIEQAEEIVNGYDGDLNIIVGDFNAGPEIAPNNYEFLETKGYVDAYFSYCVEKGLEPEITWDANNILNEQGTHSDSISQRIDHVFLSQNLAKMTTVSHSEVIFKEPTVDIGAEQKVTLSDHYGITATLLFN